MFLEIQMITQLVHMKGSVTPIASLNFGNEGPSLGNAIRIAPFCRALKVPFIHLKVNVDGTAQDGDDVVLAFIRKCKT